MAEPVMTVGELERFLAAEFPQVFHPTSGLAIEARLGRRLPRAASLTMRPRSGPAAPSPDPP